MKARLPKTDSFEKILLQLLNLSEKSISLFYSDQFMKDFLDDQGWVGQRGYIPRSYIAGMTPVPTETGEGMVVVDGG